MDTVRDCRVAVVVASEKTTVTDATPDGTKLSKASRIRSEAFCGQSTVPSGMAAICTLAGRAGTTKIVREADVFSVPLLPSVAVMAWASWLTTASVARPSVKVTVCGVLGLVTAPRAPVMMTSTELVSSSATFKN